MRIGTLKTDYAADEALFDTRLQKLLILLACAAAVLFPFVASPYWLFLACLCAINVASATGLNILTGYTGLVSLGQAAFMSVGAYMVAVLEIHAGTPFLLNLLIGGLLTALVGGLFIGVVEAFAGTFLGGEYRFLVTFSILILILMLRPYGLFGTHEIERL